MGRRALAVGVVAFGLLVWQSVGAFADFAGPDTSSGNAGVDLFEGHRLVGTDPGEGLRYTGSWGNFQIGWEILGPGAEGGDADYFTYTYTLYHADSFSGMNLEVSRIITQTNLGVYIINPDPAPVAGSPDLWEAFASPDFTMPADIYGLRYSNVNLQDGPEANSYIFSFLSPQEPIWGDFYARDGHAHPQAGLWAAWNSGIGTDPGTGTADWTPWIAVPDSGGAGQIPEPSSLLLLTLGGCGVLVRRLRRKP